MSWSRQRPPSRCSLCEAMLATHGHTVRAAVHRAGGGLLHLSPEGARRGQRGHAASLHSNRLLPARVTRDELAQPRGVVAGHVPAAASFSAGGAISRAPVATTVARGAAICLGL